MEVIMKKILKKGLSVISIIIVCSMIVSLLGILPDNKIMAELPDAANTRQILNFNTDWKFIFEDNHAARMPGFDDSDAPTVNLPHTREYYDLLFIERDVQTRIETINWYRRNFTISEENINNRVFVHFIAGGQINRVYVNGFFVGESKGSFTQFRFDITDYVMFGDITM